MESRRIRVRGRRGPGGWGGGERKEHSDLTRQDVWGRQFNCLGKGNGELIRELISASSPKAGDFRELLA